jgi:hypothetical protein
MGTFGFSGEVLANMGKQNAKDVQIAPLSNLERYENT